MGTNPGIGLIPTTFSQNAMVSGYAQLGDHVQMLGGDLIVVIHLWLIVIKSYVLLNPRSYTDMSRASWQPWSPLPGWRHRKVQRWLIHTLIHEYLFSSDAHPHSWYLLPIDAHSHSGTFSRFLKLFDITSSVMLLPKMAAIPSHSSLTPPAHHLSSLKIIFCCSTESAIWIFN